MDREKAILRDAYARQKADLSMYAYVDFRRVSKGLEPSKSTRDEGNTFYTQKQHTNQTHQQILRLYNRCILTAPNDSEHLALGYGNRSAFLLHVDRHSDCIKDVDRALKITNSTALKIKLLCRKAQCLKMLGSLAESDTVLKEAQGFVNGMNEKERSLTNALINKVANMKISTQSDPEKELRLREIKDPFQCVTIAHSQKFGRHLVAAKDFIPGDVIFTEKYYASFVSKKMSYTNCDYCLKIVWSGIPCQECSWVIYCDEDCHKKAVNSYHDVECSLIPFLMAVMQSDVNMVKLPLRAVIVGIKEAGGLDELRARLKKVDQCKDPVLKGFYKDGKFTNNTIESMYSIDIDYLPLHCITKEQTEAVFKTLIGIAYQTKLVKNFVFDKVEDIVRNKDMEFLGALILKFLLLQDCTNEYISGKHHVCEQGNAIEECYKTSCCARATFLSSLTSLLNHDCNPNAGKCFTDHRQVVLYALRPIKKNEQICITYCCLYSQLPLTQRREALEGYNIFNCFCQACKENWPPYLTMKIMNNYNVAIKSKPEEKLFNEFYRFFAIFQPNTMVKNKHAYFKNKDLKKLSKAVTEAYQKIQQPSFVTTLLVVSLGEAFSYLYGLRPRSFGKCERYQKSDVDDYIS